jgi:hypothetical protein
MIQIFLMPLIMIGQNLQGEHSDARAEADFEVNTRAEMEIENILLHLENQNQLIMEILSRLEKKRRGEIISYESTNPRPCLLTRPFSMSCSLVLSSTPFTKSLLLGVLYILEMSIYSLIDTLIGYSREVFQLTNRHFHQYEVECSYAVHLPVFEIRLDVLSQLLIVLVAFLRRSIPNFFSSSH